MLNLVSIIETFGTFPLLLQDKSEFPLLRIVLHVWKFCVRWHVTMEFSQLEYSILNIFSDIGIVVANCFSFHFDRKQIWFLPVLVWKICLFMEMQLFNFYISVKEDLSEAVSSIEVMSRF